jgi:hypothetical protein
MSYLTVADTIIFLDINPFICLWRVIKRHFFSDKSSRRDIPDESTDWLTRRLIWRVLVFPFSRRKEFERDLQYCDPKRIIRLRSPKEVDEFLVRLEQEMGHTQEVASALSHINARSLVGSLR